MVLIRTSTLSEQSYFILLSLADEPLHGYGIIKKIDELSEHRLKVAAGTLYGAIEKLKKDKLIFQIIEEDESRRKIYSLSESGLDMLEKDFKYLQQRYLVSKSILEKGGL